MRIHQSHFMHFACFLLLGLTVSIVTDDSFLETPKEAWIVSGRKYIHNCSYLGGEQKKIKLYWEKDGKLIKDMSSRFLKEVKINATRVQLMFVNAQVDEAGNYSCIAEEESGRLLIQTTYIHIGDLPMYIKYACSYDHDKNELWISPLLAKEDNLVHLEISFCESNLVNGFCSLIPEWHNATCELAKMACSFRIKREKKYVLQIKLANEYGKTINKTIVESAERKCIDTHPELISILLTNDNRFSIQWKLPPSFILAFIRVFENSTGQKIEEQLISENKGVLRTSKHLRKCTMYTICIGNMQMTSCYTRSTANGYIPKMTNIKSSENKIKNSLEIFWTDPIANSDTSSRVFFYNFTVIQGPTGTKWSSVNSTQLSIPYPKVDQITFILRRCTPCGCGETGTKVFQISRPENESKKPERKNLMVAVFVSCGVIVLIVLCFSVLWYYRKSCRNQPQNENEPQIYREIPTDPMPLQPRSHVYEQVRDAENLYNGLDEVQHYGENHEEGLNINL